MGDIQGVALGLTAALAWGLTDTIATFASRRVGSLRATAGTQLTSVAVLAVLLLASGTALPSDPAVVLTALACGAVAAVAYLAFFTALRHGPITVVSPVVATYGGLTVVLSVVLLGEAPAPAWRSGSRWPRRASCSLRWSSTAACAGPDRSARASPMRSSPWSRSRA